MANYYYKAASLTLLLSTLGLTIPAANADVSYLNVTDTAGKKTVDYCSL